MISWARKQIALKQIKTQKSILENVWLRNELLMSVESSAEAWAFHENIKRELELIAVAEKAVIETPSKKKRVWSLMILFLYDWATKDRFKF